MKRIISTLLITILFIGLMATIAIPAFAFTGTTGDCTWTLNGTELTISGTGAMGDYWQDAPWGTSITKVTIEEGVTFIGDYAFYECSGLTSIIIPDSVTTIGYYAFEGCTGLTSITIGNGVTSIYEKAFYNCSGLTSITIPDSVTYMGYSVFEACYDLTSVTIGNGLTSISPDTFSGCYDLTSITIGNGVTSIGVDAFYDCDSLTSVYITDIAQWCAIDFESNPLYYYPRWDPSKLYLNSELITDLVIPEGVTTIPGDAFS